MDEKQSMGEIHLRTQYKGVPGAAAGDRHALWRPSKQRDAAEPELAAVLRQVSHDYAVL